MVRRLPIITQCLSSVKAGIQGQECLIPNSKRLAHQAPIPPLHFPTAQVGFHINGSAYVSVLDFHPCGKSLRRNKNRRQGLLNAWVAGSLFLLWDKGLVEWNSSPHNGQESERQWKLKTSHQLQECTPINCLFKLSLISESFRLAMHLNNQPVRGWAQCLCKGPYDPVTSQRLDAPAVVQPWNTWVFRGMLHTETKAVPIALRF